jgi:ABC-type transport system substrate-binding protein
MRKLFVLLSFLVVASMVLVACGTPATPTEAPAAPAPAATQAPAAATVAPTVAPTEAPGALSRFIGSGQLDGNGIPADFFSDVHIRKAFSYAFDWDTFIKDVYNGEAVQSFQLPLAGMPGYDPNAPHYTFDLAKAAEEFKLADVVKDGIPAGTDPEGDVWTNGFRIQMAYNQGNTTRQIVAEILAGNLVQVNEKFLVETLGLPWPAYLAAQRAGQIPIMTAGWQEDIHDPHNWYQPYTTGSYGGRQNMPADLKAQFKAILDRGVGETDPAKRADIYKEANQLYYDTVPGVPLVSATSHGFEQKWLEGRIFNPIFPGDYYAPMSKTAGAKNPTTITQATIGDIDTMDPALAYDTASGEIIQNVYETLVFYDGAATDKFVPMLADKYDVSADGKTWTFHIRPGVKFHDGADLTASDVAYSFQRGLLQGGTASPQWLLTEPFFGVGVDDIAAVVDPNGSVYDDRAKMSAFDPAALKAACEKTKAAIVADDAAGTVTMTLAQPWGPFLPTIAQTWGAVMNQKWVAANGGWDGSCDTWQNFYAMTSAEDPFTGKTNGTGPYKLDHWTPGQEIVLARNDAYWGTKAKTERVVVQIIPEWGTRFAELQAGDADFVDVPVENRSQADALVGEKCVFDLAANAYKACEVTDAKQPLRLHIGRPSIIMDVVIYNFAIK